MAVYKDGISPKVREMVNRINTVGIAKVSRYCKRFHPRFDFDKALMIVRYVAQHGYSNAGRLFGVSKQLAEQKLKKLYEIAKEAEIWQENL